MFCCRQALGKSLGFTLHELIVTIAMTVAGSIAAVGIFNLIVSERLVAQTNELLADLYVTRSAAIQRNSRAMLCKSSDGETCTTDSLWHEGWIVFVDDNANERREEDELLVRVHDAMPDGYYVKLAVFGGSRQGVTYLASGLANYNNGTFTFCHQEDGRAVILNNAGRPRVSRTQSSGAPLVCP